jgi:hypothetical protein
MNNSKINWLVEATSQVKQNTGEDCIVIQHSSDTSVENQKPNYIAVQLVTSGKYFKLYDRDIIIKQQIVHDLNELHKRVDGESKYNLDTQTSQLIKSPVECLISMLESEDIFPNFEFITDDFFVTEWLVDYQSLQLIDIFENASMLNLSQAIGVTDLTPKPTKLLKDIYAKVEEFSQKNKLNHNIEGLPVFPTFNRLELLRNFHLKKTPDGKVEDLKFTGLARIIYSDTPTRVYIVHDGKWPDSQPEETNVPTVLYNSQYFTV